MASDYAFVNDRLPIGRGFEVGRFSIVGQDDDTVLGSIGNDVVVGSLSYISISAELADDVVVDSFCRIGERSTIGPRTQILYGSQIFAHCSIGSDCVIAGEIPNRVTIEDCVTFMGDIAHTYNDAMIPWDSLEEPSPIIRRGSVVGMRSLLVGPVEIGPRAYVAAGEVVRFDVPADTVLFKGELSDIRKWRGTIRGRELPQ